MKEYDKFEKGAANSNGTTTILEKQLRSSDNKIIITTIQKLSHFIKRSQKNSSDDYKCVFNRKTVIIFDECHRSQFGEMHRAITKVFKHYFIFGFTGTPVFAVNSNQNSKFPGLKTTEQIFGKRLHTYTIVNAIEDKNVLPFHVDYIRTMKRKEEISDQDVYDIAREEALLHEDRITLIANYILEHFAMKTRRDKKYKYYSDNRELRLKGFNSIFAVQSIGAAKLYYNKLQQLQKNLPETEKLKIATIYSYGVNDDSSISDDLDGIDDENNEDTSMLSQSDRDFLDSAIEQYNRDFGTNYDTSAAKFPNYYKDISLKVKNRQIDILIVVNMFLTGFDAATLNTLWVDKKMRDHGLIQAFSHTNRILNSIKTYGNIVCFRPLEERVKKAIALFGDKDADSIVLLRSYDEYYNGYTNKNGQRIPGYTQLIEELLEKWPIDESLWEKGELYKKRFIMHYNAILKLRNILLSFDQFESEDAQILSEREVQNYQSIYFKIHDEFPRPPSGEAVSIIDDLVFEIELIKSQAINIDYILQMVKQYHEDNCRDQEIEAKIREAIDSSFDLRKKKDLILKFLSSTPDPIKIYQEWNDFVNETKKLELDKLIEDENLIHERTYRLVEKAFVDGEIRGTGEEFSAILPPISRFSPEYELDKKHETVLTKLRAYFERFFDI
jgi:type I restriction enzyme R subunit